MFHSQHINERPTPAFQPPLTNCCDITILRQLAAGCKRWWGAASGTSALPADLSPNLSSIGQARIRLFDIHPLTAVCPIREAVRCQPAARRVGRR